ncbi:MAG: hypothetical protein R6W70_02105 [bacterium]
MLPFVLIPFLLFSNNSSNLPGFFNVFYQKPSDYDSWLSKHRRSIAKDIFMAKYRLPAKKLRHFSHRYRPELLKSFSDNTKYFYLYINSRKNHFETLVVSGVKKGSLWVNGVARGALSLKKSLDYSVIELNLSKGVFFFVFRIEEKFEDFPITVLSKKKLNLSENRGFTSKAKAEVKISNIFTEKTEKQDFFLKLYRGFCFPAPDMKSSGNTDFYGRKNHGVLIEYLAAARFKDEDEAVLSKTGFSKKQLNWWKNMFNNKKVCYFE